MVIVSLPESIAESLISKKFAQRYRRPKGVFSEWIISGMAEASIWVTLLQTPAVFEYYANLLRGRAEKNGGHIEVSIIKPGQSKALSFRVESGTDVHELVEALEILLR